VEGRPPSVTPVAYPTLTDAAEMVGVTPPTLSRLSDLVYIRAGGRDHRIPAAEVLRLAHHFRRRSIDEVAFDLVAYCEAHAPDLAEAVAAEVDAAVATFYQAASKPSIAGFLRDARRFLPSGLFSQVAKAVSADVEAPRTATPRAAIRPTVTRRPGAAARGSKGLKPSKRKVREPV
jgi:hypothetical protein